MKHVIGRRIKINRHWVVEVIVEGDKECLEFILKLVSGAREEYGCEAGRLEGELEDVKQTLAGIHAEDTKKVVRILSIKQELDTFIDECIREQPPKQILKKVVKPKVRKSKLRRSPAAKRGPKRGKKK